MLLLSWSTLYIYSIFKRFSILVLVFLFWFSTINPTPKVTFSWNLSYSTMGSVLLHRSWSTLHIVTSKCIVSSSQIFCFNLPLFTKIACVKDNFSWNFRCSVSFVKHHVYSIFKMYSILVLVLFWFPIINPTC